MYTTDIYKRQFDILRKIANGEKITITQDELLESIRGAVEYHDGCRHSWEKVSEYSGPYTKEVLLKCNKCGELRSILL